jgi:Kef-type K+ transport system membrane component KefB
MTEEVKEEAKKKGKELVYSFVSVALTLVLFIIGYGLAFYWFDEPWKFVIVITIILWANNIQMTTNITNKMTSIVKEAIEITFKKFNK